ncbi:MAG TPA: sulfur carrier protein ThiS [Burkholderiales bacterium]|nr:sulfur carrier protein ThiS [Burkholderiales bacterium]
MIELTINGARKQIHKSATVDDLIIELDLVGKKLAIERNGDIVPRSAYPATPLQAGDKLEIVVAVGGG